MIPIRYRLDLDTDAEKEYIEKVLPCINNANDYSGKLEVFLEHMEQSGWPVGRRILDEARRFGTDYPGRCYLCKWLVMSYEEMAEIRNYLDDIIRSDLTLMNAFIKKISRNIKEIKSYHDLLERRKINYTANTIISKLVSFKVNYDKIYNDFKNFITYYEHFPKMKINDWIIEKTELKVCPYCNITYTYSRGNTTTAQLDHFFPKSEYPIFALCFYNLIPSCPACNKLKYDDVNAMASPYKDKVFENLRFTWEYKGNGDKYSENNNLATLEEMIEIKIQDAGEDEQHNLTKMKIEEAYQQHRDYASEIIKKARTYTNPEAQKLICNIGAAVGVSAAEVERFYLGNYMGESDLKKRPLSKMTRDFYHEIVTNIH